MYSGPCLRLRVTPTEWHHSYEYAHAAAVDDNRLVERQKVGPGSKLTLPETPSADRAKQAARKERSSKSHGRSAVCGRDRSCAHSFPIGKRHGNHRAGDRTEGSAAWLVDILTCPMDCF